MRWPFRMAVLAGSPGRDRPDDVLTRTILHIPRQLLIGMVRLYQLILSPHIGSSCNFTPTCSAYAIEALSRYGALKGSVLAIHRILRCNPWGGHGYDPPRWYSEPEDT